MKKIVLAAAFLILSVSAFAQNVQLKNAKRGDLVNSPNLAPYVGVWISHQGNKTLKLKLIDTVMIVGDLELRVKAIKGGFLYVVDGITRYNSFDSKRGGLVGSQIANNKLQFFISDGITKRQGVGTFELLNDQTMRMVLSEKKSEFKTPDEGKEFSIPQNIVFNKAN